MEVKNAKGGTYPLALFVMLMLLLNAYCCDAAVLVKSNTTVRCNGRLDECLIEDDLELEFLINPYISRVLAGTGESVGEDDFKAESPPCSASCSGNPDQSCIECSRTCRVGSLYHRKPQCWLQSNTMTPTPIPTPTLTLGLMAMYFLSDIHLLFYILILSFSFSFPVWLYFFLCLYVSW